MKNSDHALLPQRHQQRTILYHQGNFRILQKKDQPHIAVNTNRFPHVLRFTMANVRESLSYAKGEKKLGYSVHIPKEIDVKHIRDKLHLNQREFSQQFGLTVGGCCKELGAT